MDERLDPRQRALLAAFVAVEADILDRAEAEPVVHGPPRRIGRWVTVVGGAMAAAAAIALALWSAAPDGMDRSDPALAPGIDQAAYAVEHRSQRPTLAVKPAARARPPMRTRPEPAPVVDRPLPLPEPPPVPPRTTKARVRTARPTAEIDAAELPLLERATAAYRAGRAQDARVAIAEHASRFPDSRLRPEREALRLCVACALGEADASDRRRFLATEPAPHLRAAIQRACGSLEKKNNDTGNDLGPSPTPELP